MSNPDRFGLGLLFSFVSSIFVSCAVWWWCEWATQDWRLSWSWLLTTQALFWALVLVAYCMALMAGNKGKGTE